jgi:hypothetical protein
MKILEIHEWVPILVFYRKSEISICSFLLVHTKNEKQNQNKKYF